MSNAENTKLPSQMPSTGDQLRSPGRRITARANTGSIKRHVQVRGRQRAAPPGFEARPLRKAILPNGLVNQAMFLKQPSPPRAPRTLSLGLYTGRGLS